MAPGSGARVRRVKLAPWRLLKPERYPAGSGRGKLTLAGTGGVGSCAPLFSRRPADERSRWQWNSRAKAELTSCWFARWAPPAMVLEEGYLGAVHYQNMVDEQRQAAQARLDGLAARARRAGVRASTHVLDGHPYDQIVRAAEHARADLVVLETHGRTRLARLLPGSVARRVTGLRRANTRAVVGGSK